ncbi:MAG TPA: hypothetical protein VD813_12545, partial [Pseudonocardia sp.]|nr:hypothetical protein [Pseudonocardia sp.]
VAESGARVPAGTGEPTSPDGREGRRGTATLTEVGMGRLYSYTYMSLDGVVESPEKWVGDHFSDEMADDLHTRLHDAEAMVLGGTTYGEFADFWPTAVRRRPVRQAEQLHAQVRRLRHDRESRVHNTTLVGSGLSLSYRPIGTAPETTS